MKKNLEYYSRYCNAHQHPKFKVLRSKYGWEGDGRFWALNDMIGSADNCILDLNKKYLAGTIADDLGMSLDKFQEFFSFLVSDQCDLIQEVGENKYTTELVQEIYGRIEADRKAARDRKNKATNTVPDDNLTEFGEQSSSSGEPSESSGERNNTVNKSRVKESKETTIITEGNGSGLDFIKNIKELFKDTWDRPPKNNSEIVAVEKMMLNYSEKHIIQAFRRSAELDKLNVAYVKGILKKHYEQIAAKKERVHANRMKLEKIGIDPNRSTIKIN